MSVKIIPVLVIHFNFYQINTREIKILYIHKAQDKFKSRVIKTESVQQAQTYNHWITDT